MDNPWVTTPHPWVTSDNYSSNNPSLQLKDIKFEFLVDYIGLTKDKTGFTWMVYEDCIKGTLQQTLEDESFEIDAQFKLSMIDDIAQVWKLQ